MRVDQHDIAQVSDATVKRLALMYDELSRDPDLAADGLNAFSAALSRALVHAMRERRRLMAYAELELDDDEGELLPDPQEEA